jgi:ABC-type uncharacterized transport system involved in gliding motility auxiliary subunit
VRATRKRLTILYRYSDEPFTGFVEQNIRLHDASPLEPIKVYERPIPNKATLSVPDPSTLSSSSRLLVQIVLFLVDVHFIHCHYHHSL